MSRLTERQYKYMTDEFRRIREVSRTKNGRGWRKHAWHALYEVLEDYEEEMRTAIPLGVTIYTHAAQMLVIYLGRHPNVDHFLKAHRKIRADFDEFLCMLEDARETDITAFLSEESVAKLRLHNQYFSIAESQLIRDMGQKCYEAMNQIAAICPVPR